MTWESLPFYVSRCRTRESERPSPEEHSDLGRTAQTLNMTFVLTSPVRRFISSCHLWQFAAEIGLALLIACTLREPWPIWSFAQSEPAMISNS